MKKYLIFIFLAPIFLINIFAAPQPQEKIVFSRYTKTNWQIWLKDLSSGKETQLTFTPVDKRAPYLSYDGNKLFYRTANSQIFEYDLKSKKDTQLLNIYGVIMDQTLSPDEKTIAFARMRPDLPDDSEVWVSDLSGNNARPLTDDKGLQYGPVFSPDGQRVVYVSTNSEGGQTLNLIDIDGKNKEALTTGNFYDVNPRFSPDGKKVVFASNRAGDYDIWQIDCSSGATPSAIHKNPGMDSNPILSNDGKKIIYMSVRSGTKQIWVMDSDGKNPVQLTDDKTMPAQDPAWVVNHE